MPVSGVVEMFVNYFAQGSCRRFLDPVQCLAHVKGLKLTLNILSKVSPLVSGNSYNQKH